MLRATATAHSSSSPGGKHSVLHDGRRRGGACRPVSASGSRGAAAARQVSAAHNRADRTVRARGADARPSCAADWREVDIPADLEQVMVHQIPETHVVERVSCPCAADFFPVGGGAEDRPL